MKLPPSIPRTCDTVGIMLIECLVYIAVFTVIVGLGLATFYLCWDNSKALRYATDDITAALRTGERWRADIRSATGEITVETTAAGELLRIPHGTNEVLYRFNAGEIRRQSAPSGFAEPMLTAVKSSQMVMDRRGPVNAWRWELELKPRRPETRLPLLFTFEAAKTAP
jgi:hypothetical protein